MLAVSESHLGANLHQLCPALPQAEVALDQPAAALPVFPQCWKFSFLSMLDI